MHFGNPNKASATHSEMALRILLWAILLTLIIGGTHGQDSTSTTLVPAVITFGDSSVDVGNNNYLPTIFKADYPPYGRDFSNHMATGRFSNGKLVPDIIAEALGFSTYPPAYLSPEATGSNLLTGVNFASAASGYDSKAASLNHAITLPKQLEYFKDYTTKLRNVAGTDRAASIVRDALYIVSAGSSDFILNYYINPFVNTVYTHDQYSSTLLSSFSTFVSELYEVGARRIGVTSLPPLGCFPAAITLLGFKDNDDRGCISRINTNARAFNRKLRVEATRLQRRLSDLKIVIFDIYNPLYNLIRSPSHTGFREVQKGCCGTGRVETTVLLCNPMSIGTCLNATQFVFWDSVHPSEAANQVLSDAIILQGISLVTTTNS